MYCVYVVRPPGYQMYRVVDELAMSLSVALKRLDAGGKIVSSLFDRRGRIPIILLPNLLKGAVVRDVPPDAILYNLEQVSAESGWFDGTYLSLLRGLEVWDFDERNRLGIAELGAGRTKHCPIGYVPELTRIAPAPEEDIDVLFYGCVNERRHRILHALEQSGLKVYCPQNAVFGHERDQLIARSKVVLNIHFFDSKVLEMVRISYLLSNRKCVLTESTPGGLGYLEGGLAGAPYDMLVDRCHQLVHSESERQAIGNLGYELFSMRRLEDILDPLLSKS